MAVSSSQGDRSAGRDETHSPSVAEFVSQASHDLKTPLAAITGYSMTLERRGESLDPALRNEMLEHIGQAASRMHSAVEQLVDFARLELGIIEPVSAVVDLYEAAGEAASSLSEKHPDAEVEMVAGGSAKVFADPDRLDQVLTVVIENALRHGNGKARVSVVSEGPVAKVKVEDAGAGVPEDLESRIFSADLKRRPRLGQPRGLGIALHNARRLLRLQGGDLALSKARSSGEYPGAVFEISLPTAEAAEGGR